MVADAPVPPGDYLFSCTGRCELVIIDSKANVKGVLYNRDTNTTTATVTVDKDAEKLFIAFKRTTGGVKNIRLLRPGYPLTTDQIFNKDFLAALDPFTTMRMMDFTRTNETDAKEWADRPKPTDALQSSHARRRLGIRDPTRQSNQKRPLDQHSRRRFRRLHQATGSFCPAKNLNKDRAVYVEYSNEVWNTIFPQYHVNFDQAQAEVAAGNSPHRRRQGHEQVLLGVETRGQTNG